MHVALVEFGCMALSYTGAGEMLVHSTYICAADQRKPNRVQPGVGTSDRARYGVESCGLPGGARCPLLKLEPPSDPSQSKTNIPRKTSHVKAAMTAGDNLMMSDTCVEYAQPERAFFTEAQQARIRVQARRGYAVLPDGYGEARCRESLESCACNDEVWGDCREDAGTNLTPI